LDNAPAAKCVPGIAAAQWFHAAITLPIPYRQASLIPNNHQLIVPDFQLTLIVRLARSGNPVRLVLSVLVVIRPTASPASPSNPSSIISRVANLTSSSFAELWTAVPRSETSALHACCIDAGNLLAMGCSAGLPSPLLNHIAKDAPRYPAQRRHVGRGGKASFRPCRFRKVRFVHIDGVARRRSDAASHRIMLLILSRRNFLSLKIAARLTVTKL
jgi:hypothetical protein